MTFWDFCAPFYDFAQSRNGRAYNVMLKTVREIVPQGASVLEVAAGTGAISLSIADKATDILCSDISERMLAIARKKAMKQGVSNIRFDNINIFETGKPNNAFDAVIAGQVLHLIDEPEKAASELRRIAKTMVLLPISLTESLSASAKLTLGIWRLFGFAPKAEFNAESYAAFLPRIGFEGCEITQIVGKIPMSVAVWRKNRSS